MARKIDIKFPMSGGQKWKKEKLERQVVKRVIMGPKDLFTATIIEDELAVDKSLSVWGVLLETGNPVEPLAFIEEFMGKDGVQPLIGYIRMGAATNLTKPESWTDPEVLNFGSADVNAQGDWGGRTEVLSHPRDEPVIEGDCYICMYT